MLKSFFVLTVIGVLAFAALAQAQPAGRRGASATLYDGDNFSGRQVTVSGSVPNLSNYNFNDKAHSLRLQGRWRLCEHANLEGRCVELSGDVAELNTMALAERITSLEPVGFSGGSGGGGGGYDPRPGPGPGGGWGRGAPGVEGARNVFFARPSVRGVEVAAGSNGANSFCRAQGLGAAAFYESSGRAGQAIGPNGELVGPSSTLRDLLCRKD